MTNAFALAKEEVTTAIDNNVRLSEGGSFNQYKIIQKVIRYTRSQYNTLNDGSLFYNISNQRIPLYAKSIDADTKDFYINGVGKVGWFKQWALNVRYKKWARENVFALILYENSTSISTFGSTVWKKSFSPSGKVVLEEANLQNLYFDPTVKNIIDSPVVELHYLTESQIRSKYDLAEDKPITAEEGRNEEGDTSETTTRKYKVHERWGDLDGVYMHHIMLGKTTLFEEEIKIDKETGLPSSFPYYDFHGERVKGRWLGLGVVERLFNIQAQVNKLVNQNDEANDIASLLLFRTSDPNTNGNILEELSSGSIINSEDFQEMAISNRFLQGFITQLRELENKADQLCYIKESISGERPPSGVPFRSVALASRGAVSTFDYIKKHIVEKMGMVLYKEFLPELVKNFNKEDVLEIAEEENDVRLYEEMVIEQENTRYMEERSKKGMVTFEEDLQKLENSTRGKLQTNKKVHEIGKGFFDFEYNVIMAPTNDSVDKAARFSSIDSAIEVMVAAPAVVDTPIFQQKLAESGIPPFRLTPKQQAELQQTSGNIPTPQAPQDKLSALAAV